MIAYAAAKALFCDTIQLSSSAPFKQADTLIPTVTGGRSVYLDKSGSLLFISECEDESCTSVSSGIY